MCEIYGKNIIIFGASLPFLFVACTYYGSEERDMLYMRIDHAFIFEICVQRKTKDFSGVFKIQISFLKTVVATCRLSVSAPFQYDWGINPYKLK